MTKRPEKKSETIEVRVSYSEKLAFMEACKQAGTTASHAIRSYIDDFLHPKPEDSLSVRLKRLLPVIAGMIAIAASVVFLMPGGFGRDTVFAENGGALTTGQRVVNYFDKNGDGFLSSADITDTDGINGETVNWLLEIGDNNTDGRLSAPEFEDIGNFTIEVNRKYSDAAMADRRNGDNIVIFRPDMNDAERQAFIEESGLAGHMSPEDFARLEKLLDVLIEDTEQSGSTDAETARN